jgi:TPR repeat protein
MVLADRGAPLEQTMPLAVKAAQLAPGEIEHSLTALRLAARAGAVEETRRRAEALRANASAEDRAKVESLLAELAFTRPSVALGSDVRTTCEHGDAAACVAAGQAAERDDGVEGNPAEAARFYEGACATGALEACGRLGSLLRQGRGVSKDARRAQVLLAKACNGASAFACGELGRLLREGGPGVPADAERARALLRRACEGGDEASCPPAGR